MVVDENGRPNDFAVVHGMGMGLDEKAMEVAKHFKFNPAMKDGTIPVSVKIMIEFKFSTNRRRTPDQMSSTTPLNPATDSPEKAPEVLGSYAMNEVADVASLPSQACEGGSLSACSRLGVMYAHGIGVTKDASLAIASFTRACNGGDAQGCVNLGISYADGAGVAVDQPRAAAIYSRACTDGNAMGCSLLGDSYRHGKGVIKDSGKAKEFLQRGCNMGDSNGCQWLKEII
jgi:TonB family protein